MSRPRLQGNQHNLWHFSAVQHHILVAASFRITWHSPWQMLWRSNISCLKSQERREKETAFETKVIRGPAFEHWRHQRLKSCEKWLELHIHVAFHHVSSCFFALLTHAHLLIAHHSFAPIKQVGASLDSHVKQTSVVYVWHFIAIMYLLATISSFQSFLR